SMTSFMAVLLAQNRTHADQAYQLESGGGKTEAVSVPREPEARRRSLPLSLINCLGEMGGSGNKSCSWSATPRTWSTATVDNSVAVPLSTDCTALTDRPASSATSFCVRFWLRRTRRMRSPNASQSATELSVELSIRTPIRPLMTILCY